MSKKIKIIFVFVVLFFVFFLIISNNRNSIENSTAFDQTIKIDGPVIEVNEKSYDFGVVKYGDVSEHIVKITNTGTEDLKILKISTSCGCTKASVSDDDKTILPGETVDMLVTFDPAVHKDDSDLGRLQRIVYVKTNDPAKEEIEIEITAIVLKAEKFKTIDVTAQRWFFSPDPIEVEFGDYVELRITSIDGTHSFTLPDFGIDEKVKDGEKVIVKFLADKKGTFEFYCAIQCGGGHDSMRGKLIVN